MVPPSAQFSNQSPRSSFIFPHPASTQPVLLPAIIRFVPFSFPCIVLASHSQMLLSPLHLCPSSPSHLPARLSPLHPPLPLRSVLPQKPQRPLTLIAPKMQCGPTKFPRKLNSLLCLGIPVYSVPELPSLLAMVSQKLSSLGVPGLFFLSSSPVPGSHPQGFCKFCSHCLRSDSPALYPAILYISFNVSASVSLPQRKLPWHPVSVRELRINIHSSLKNSKVNSKRCNKVFSNQLIFLF